MNDENFEFLFKKLKAEKEKAENKDEFSDELSGMYLKEILIDILRKHGTNFQKELTKTEELIISAENYIDKNFHEDIKIDKLAQMFFLNSCYFSHCFKTFSGMSPKQYLTQVRMNNALKLLKNTELTVLEITQNCGFSDVNNFIRLFKKNFNITPLEYRNNHLL